jgi:hypothetical protein
MLLVLELLLQLGNLDLAVRKAVICVLDTLHHLRTHQFEFPLGLPQLAQFHQVTFEDMQRVFLN